MRKLDLNSTALGVTPFASNLHEQPIAKRNRRTGSKSSAHQEARKVAAWDENRLDYGILSKGIHELAEDECLKYFKPLESVIELILNEHILLQEHERNVLEAEQSLADVHREISEGG